MTGLFDSPLHVRSTVIRALPPIFCIGANSCKELGGVHVSMQECGGSARRNAHGADGMTCISLESLHEIKLLQEIGGSARWAVRIPGKCTPSCKNKGEVHVTVQRLG